MIQPSGNDRHVDISGFSFQIPGAFAERIDDRGAAFSFGFGLRGCILSVEREDETNGERRERRSCHETFPWIEPHE